MGKVLPELKKKVGRGCHDTLLGRGARREVNELFRSRNPYSFATRRRRIAKPSPRNARKQGETVRNAGDAALWQATSLMKALLRQRLRAVVPDAHSPKHAKLAGAKAHPVTLAPQQPQGVKEKQSSALRGSARAAKKTTLSLGEIVDPPTIVPKTPTHSSRRRKGRAGQVKMATARRRSKR